MRAASRPIDGSSSAVEAHHVERPQDQAEWLAHHAVRGELWNKAALYQGQAAERALARGSYAEAIAGMRAALKSFDEATPSPEATQRAIDQLRSLRALLYATGGDVAEIHRILVRAEELALGTDDRVRLGWVRADQSAQFWVEGDNEAAITAARRALEIAEQAGETRLRALALFRLGLGFYATGDYAQATDALRRSVELLAGELRVERIGTAGATSVIAAGYLITTLCELGRFDEAELCSRECGRGGGGCGRRLFDRVGADGALHAGDREGGRRGGSPRPARDAAGCGQGRRRARGVAIHRDLAGPRPVRERRHDRSAGAAGAEEGIQRRASGARARAGQGMAGRGAGRGSADRRGDGRARRRRARRAERGERGTLAHCWKARGELARAAGDLVEAEIQYRRSLAQARQLSMMPVCEACEAALAALAALQTGSSVERNVEV